jgi:ABC-type antimicrobial peptide transport system permease subunit
MPRRVYRELNFMKKDRLAAAIRDVWDGIRTQPGRVGLSFMAITIGIASLTVLIAVLGGLRTKSHQIVKELGVNVVGILQQGQTDPNASARLQERHAALLAENFPDFPISTIRRFQVPTLGTQALLSVVATDSSFNDIRQWKLHDGRFFDHRDMENSERNAVVSKSLSRLWNWKVGNLIMLRNIAFRIVGIVAVGGGALDTEFGDSGLMLGEHVVFVPKTVRPYWMSDAKRPKRFVPYRVSNPMGPGTIIDAIFMRVPAFANFSHVVSNAQNLLSDPAYRLDGISWVTPESLIQGIQKLQNTISLTVGSIALLCLVLGGTTLMSLMVANVRERVMEIGLRRALGASQWDIAALFVMEACVVAGGAAVVATLATNLLLSLGRQAFPTSLRLGWVSILTPLIVAVFLGIVFSYWPARFAAKITPSEALRNE